MDEKINIHIGSGFDSSGVTEARKTLSDFRKKLMERDKWLLQINAEMSDKMHALAQSIAVDFGAAADKAARGMGRVYETLDQINARVDAPRKAAREQEELNQALKRYCEVCEEARRRREAYIESLTRKGWKNLNPGAGNAGAGGGELGDLSNLKLTSAKAAIPAIMAIDRMAGGLDGTLGKVAHGMQGVLGLSAAFGPMGAVVGGAFAVMDVAISAYVESQQEAIREMEEFYSRLGASSKAARDSHFEKLAKDVDGVAEATRRSAEMFELAARKRAEFAKTREGMDAAIAETELLDMHRQMSADVSEAGESDRGRVAAAWRLKIAEKEVELRERAAEVAAASERESLDAAEKRVEISQRSMGKLAEAEDKARSEYQRVRDIYSANYENGERDPEVERYKAEYEKARARTREAAKNYDKSRDDLEILQKQAEVEAARRSNSIAQARNAAEEASYGYESAERDYEVKAAQDAARERDRLDRELHQKRMADLRAEIAAQKEAASPLQAAAASAATEFERAFAMYRDPSRAAAEIGEEKDRAEDLERLHRDASRYGGKWRIDELSQLMAAGDSQGVDSRLAEWRKSRSFSPEVEAMVRASAAEQTKTTAEDELRKLNEKTGELTQKLETLAQSRDGKLDGIERNTNQLANKIDELLTVKG